MNDATFILEQLAEQLGPQRDELCRLPRWALVVLATRCARRVQPLAASDWPNAPSHFNQAVEEALALTEASAAEGATQEALGEAAKKAAAGATEAANMTSRFASFTVAFAAVNAANVAGAATADNAVAFTLATADSCHKAATFAAARFPGFGRVNTSEMTKALIQAMREDYTKLLKLAEKKGWTEETPVDTSLLGAVWPHGAPAGFLRA